MVCMHHLQKGEAGVFSEPPTHNPATTAQGTSMVQFPFQLQIGCHTDNLMSASKLSRAPVVTHQCHMDRTEQLVSNLWGGLLYVIVPTGCNLGPVSITIKRAVPAPYYKLGEWTERGGEEESRECCVVVGWLPRSGGERIGGQEEKALLEMAVEAGMRNPCVHGDFRAEERGGSGGPSFSAQHVVVHGNRPLSQCPPPGQFKGGGGSGGRFRDVYA